MYSMVGVVSCLYQLMEARRRGMQGGVVTVYSMVGVEPCLYQLMKATEGGGKQGWGCNCVQYGGRDSMFVSIDGS